MTLFPEAGLELIPGPPSGPPASFHFRLSERSRCFDGHFDGAPILPGVVHVALALSACAQQSERDGTRTLVGLRDVRLRRKLGPGDHVEVVLTEGREPLSVRFEIRCDGEPVTVGLLLFARADDSIRG